MPKKSDLQHLESECATVDDWTALALRALEETADQDYGAELAGNAEMDWQNPVNYVELAQFLTEHLSNSDYVENLLVKAEDACFGFEPLEYVKVANAWIGLLGNSDRGLALICEAADELNPERALLSGRLCCHSRRAKTR